MNSLNPPEWIHVGQDFALSKDQIKQLLITKTNLVDVLADIILEFLRRDQYLLSNMEQLSGMYGTFSKTANLWGQVISVPTCAFLHNFTVKMKISSGDSKISDGNLHLRLVLHEWSDTLTTGKELFRSSIHIVPMGFNGQRTFEVLTTEQHLIPPCDPEKKYLVGILYEDVNNFSSSEIGHVPYIDWHKQQQFRSVYGVTNSSIFSDLGSFGLAFSVTFSSSSWI